MQQLVIDKDFLEGKLSQYLAGIGEKAISITLADGPITTSAKILFFNRPFWKVLAKHDLPITKEISELDNTDAVLSVNRYQTRVNDALIAKYGVHNRMDWAHDIIMIVSDLSNDVRSYLGRYVSSISDFAIAKTVNDPQVRAIVDRAQFDDKSAGEMETIVNSINKDLLALLATDKLPVNAIYPYHRIGQLSYQQVPKTVGVIGVHADIDDSVVRIGNSRSYAAGIGSDRDYVVENLSAKASVWTNKSRIGDVQYANRQWHLVTASMQHLYLGDCGTTHTVNIKIPEEHSHNFLGKNIVTDIGLVQLDARNISQYAGRVVRLRSPGGCRYSDGVCEVCGGNRVYGPAPYTNLGLAASTSTTERKTQMSLNIKHFFNTSVFRYTLPIELANLAYVDQDAIYLQKERKKQLDNLEIGVLLPDMTYVHDLRFINSIGAINESYFSSLTYMFIREADTKKELGPAIELSDPETQPQFSKEFLWYLRQHLDEIVVDDILWLPLKGFDLRQPIIRCPVTNYSMRKYTKQLDGFLAKEVKLYNSYSTALTEFSDIMYKKISRNIYHLEIILKAYAITSPLNYRIPDNIDPENMLFGSTESIDLNRAIGTQMAYEDHQRMMRLPETYIIPRGISIYDPYFGFDDRVIRTGYK